MRITPMRALLPLALGLLLVGAGCGTQSTPTTEAPAPSEPATVAPTAPAPSSEAQPAPSAETVPAPEAVSVSISNFKFSPSSVTVKKGTTVTWRQEDSIPHTVTIDSGSGPDSPLLKKGETYTYKFENAGKFTYHCTVHPNMKGTVVVEE